MATASENLTLYRYRCSNKGYIEDLGGGITLVMMLIPSGEFMMGALEGEAEGKDRERPQHLVKVPQFLMGRCPITQAQYEKVMMPSPATQTQDERVRFNPTTGYRENFVVPNKPVVGVSWNDAIEFCLRLSRITERHYRLPSEAEWEYACRAETVTAYHFGDKITTELANYSQEVGQTTAVRQYPPNRWGLYDMHGNIWEWCQDYWHDSYNDAPADGSAWSDSGDSSGRVLRGGSWSFMPTPCRSTYRDHFHASNRDHFVGFRVVCSARRTLQ